MNKKEIDELIKDPIKFAQMYFPEIDIKKVYAMEKTIKELKREMKEEAKRNIIIDDPIDYSMIKFLKLHDPNRFGEELIINKKEKNMFKYYTYECACGRIFEAFTPHSLVFSCSKCGRLALRRDDNVKPKEKKMTVKKAVRDLIISNPYPFDRITGEINQQGISNYTIQTANLKHHLSGLRALRHLAAEFYIIHPGLSAYIYINNKYYIQYHFRKWLKENYKD